MQKLTMLSVLFKPYCQECYKVWVFRVIFFTKFPNDLLVALMKSKLYDFKCDKTISTEANCIDNLLKISRRTRTSYKMVKKNKIWTYILINS